jgi:hypothetical protein
MITFKNAQETKVFVFNFKNEIIETTYADHVLESIDECTHSTGVVAKYQSIEIEKEDGSIGFATANFSSNQRGYSIDQEFETEEEANDAWFSKIERNDFQRDDQRSTAYYNSYDEALKARAEDVLAYDFNISNEVALSIAKKEQILIKANRI